MSPASFEELVKILRAVITCNKTRAYARSAAGPIIPEIIINFLIRYLEGDSYFVICNLVSIPHSTFYYILWKTGDAINNCPELKFRLPVTEAELSAASAYFENIICQGIMRGCIGVINGWICCIDELPSSLVGNVQI